LPLSLDTPLQQNVKYTFHFTNTGNGLVSPTNNTVIGWLAGSLSDEIQGVSSSNPSFFVSSSYDIEFTFIGFQGTTVGDLSSAMNDLFSNSHLYGDLVFNYADGGSIAGKTLPDAPPGAASPSILPSGTSSYLWIGVGVVVLLVFGFVFVQGLGKGVGESV